jgi:acetyl esterase/lipase
MKKNMNTGKKSAIFSAMLMLLFLIAFKESPPKSHLFEYTDDFGSKKTVRTAEDWAKKRSQIISGMEKAMGKLPARPADHDFEICITESFTGDSYTRLTIKIKVAQNEIATAYLYKPFRINEGEVLPAMVVLHGTGALGKMLVDGHSPLSNRAIAKELAQRGYVVIAPDYPSMGDLKDYDFNNDRYESGTMKGIYNHMRCIDLLQTLEYVDSDRIGVIGHSLGGHNAMFLGAFDTRLKVIVASCGWTLMDYYDIGETALKRFGGRLGPWAQDRYMPLLREKFNLDPEKIPFDFDEVIAALAPRAFFSNSPIKDSNFDVEGVIKGISYVSEIYSFLNADNNLQVRYPDAGHDFPIETRLEAYHFIDNILNHSPNYHQIE